MTSEFDFLLVHIVRCAEILKLGPRYDSVPLKTTFPTVFEPENIISSGYNTVLIGPTSLQLSETFNKNRKENIVSLELDDIFYSFSY